MSLASSPRAGPGPTSAAHERAGNSSASLYASWEPQPPRVQPSAPPQPARLLEQPELQSQNMLFQHRLSIDGAGLNNETHQRSPGLKARAHLKLGLKDGIIRPLGPISKLRTHKVLPGLTVHDQGVWLFFRARSARKECQTPSLEKSQSLSAITCKHRLQTSPRNNQTDPTN